MSSSPSSWAGRAASASAQAAGVGLFGLTQRRDRADARHPGGVRLQEPGPGGGQAQQAQRMPGWCGVKHDVVVGGRDLGVGQQRDELVECGDLDRAGTGELLLDRGLAWKGALSTTCPSTSASMSCWHGYDCG